MIKVGIIGCGGIANGKQAYCVTRIPEGIYTSAKTGEVYKLC